MTQANVRPEMYFQTTLYTFYPSAPTKFTRFARSLYTGRSAVEQNYGTDPFLKAVSDQNDGLVSA